MPSNVVPTKPFKSRSSPSVLPAVSDSVVESPSFISAACERSPSGRVSSPNRTFWTALTADADRADTSGRGCTRATTSAKRPPHAAHRPPRPKRTWGKPTVEPRNSPARHWTSQPATPSVIDIAESPACSSMEAEPQITMIKSVGHETLKLAKSQASEPANIPASTASGTDSHSRPASATNGIYSSKIELTRAITALAHA